MTGDYINRQAEEERQKAVDSDSGKWILPFAAGLGAIGLGSFLLKKRVSEGGEFVSNMFNLLGVPKGISLSSEAATNVAGSQARSNTSGIRSFLNATFDFNKNKLQLGPIDIIDDLRNSVELLGNTNGNIANIIQSKTTEYVNRSLIAGGPSTGYFSKGLQRVTFGQVLKDQKTWSRVLGAEQISVIEKARSYGLVSNSMAIDKKLFFNSKTNEVLDLRLRNLVSKVTKVDTPLGPSFQRVGKFDLFGQAEIISSMFGPRNRGIALIGPGDGHNGARLFVGGDTYGFKLSGITGQPEAVHLASNKVLRRAGGPLEIIAASRQGRLTLNPSPRKGPLGWIERNLGVGPGFSNRPSFLERLVINPYKRFKALQSGEGVIFAHPNKRLGGISKATDAVIGAEFPEPGMIGGRYTKIEGGGVSRSIQEVEGRTWGVIPNRVGILFDVVDDHSVVKRKSYRDYNNSAKATLNSDDFIIPIKKGGYKINGRVIPERSVANNLTDVISDDLSAAGIPTHSKRYGYYDVDKVMGSGVLSSARDFAAYSLYRINSLASETMLGIGFAPSHKITTNLARLATVPLVYEAGRQTALYGDYLTEKVTGVSPIKAVGSIYAGARLAQQKLREITGIQQSTDFLDTYFPGSINSEGSTILRSIVAPMAVANAFLRKGKFTGAAIGAASTYGAIGGPDPGQTASDLQREYTGDKKVPIRKAAFWGMGYTPFFGGEVERYASSWYAKLMSDYRNKSIYGSDSEYWSYHANVFGIPFPTPSNLFGLSNILNPYRMEELNRDDRPYIQSSHPISNFPIIGPLLGSTLGELMKPTVFRQPDRLPLLKAGLADPGLTPSTARMMGLSAMEATSPEAESPSTISNLIAKQANIATEPLGVYKFAMEFFGISTKPELGTEYATSSTIGDPGRQLYDSTIAGAFGQTEFIRRFLLGDYSAQYRRAAAINPIRNSMPDWLPGAYSSNARDRDYFMDFTMGDPFSKLKDGEARLPGAGYESINDLHSGTPGEYSDVDKFLILSDVAPYSAAYKEYEKKVTSMGLEGRWATRVEEAIEQRRQATSVDDRYKRYEEDIIAMNMNIISKSIYEPVRKAYDFLTHDVLAEIPYIGSKFFPFRNPYEQYRKTHVEGAEYASWDRPWEGIIRPMAYDAALEDPATAAGKGAMLGFLVSGPMKWFSPFKGLVGAPGHGFNKATVFLGAGAGAGLSTARIAAGYDQDMLPSHIEEESDAINYMDKIAYIKGRMIEEAGGGGQFADNTMVGAKTLFNFRAALPRSSDRRYFDYFSLQENKDVRSQIVGGVPDYMRQGLRSTWNQNFNDREESDSETQAFLASNEIPDSSWVGWNPLVSASAAKLKFVQHGLNGISNDIHRFGFFEGHEVDMKARLSALQSQTINFVQSPMHSSFDSFITSHSNKIKKSSFRIESFATPLSNSRRNLTVYENNDQELLNKIRHR